jgi:superfamily II DNA or RNA helicase
MRRYSEVIKADLRSLRQNRSCQMSAQGLHGHQINAPSQNRFQVAHQLKIGVKVFAARCERHQEIDVTVRIDCLIPRKRAEDGGCHEAGGDRLGKSVIFARNHKHAEFIRKRLDHNYPHLAGKAARVIDNQVNYAQSLIDELADPGSDLRIAISVDMLDTGIDIPEIVNLISGCSGIQTPSFGTAFPEPPHTS